MAADDTKGALFFPDESNSVIWVAGSHPNEPGPRFLIVMPIAHEPGGPLTV